MLIVVLKDNMVSGKYIICATTHISWYGKKQSVQAIKACLITQKLNDIRNTLAQSNEDISVDDISVILAGDFNAQPETQVVQLMKNNETAKTEAVKTDCAGDSLANDPLLEYYSKYFYNPLKLCSSYEDVLGCEPCVTNSTAGYTGCLDYIFHSHDTLYTVSVFDIDTAMSSLYSSSGGPTEEFASDHLPLVAVYEYFSK